MVWIGIRDHALSAGSISDSSAASGILQELTTISYRTDALSVSHKICLVRFPEAPLQTDDVNINNTPVIY